MTRAAATVCAWLAFAASVHAQDLAPGDQVAFIEDLEVTADLRAVHGTPPPEHRWVTADVWVGLGWATGGALRDADGARGSQIDFRRDLDLDTAQPAGSAAIHLHPLTGWRITGEVTATRFDGRATQGGGTMFNPTPPTLTFDGVAFTGQVLDSELDVTIGTLGIWRALAPLEHARFQLGIGVHWLAANLEIEAQAGPRASERSQALTPWLGTHLTLPVTSWLDLDVGGRIGFLWGGDSVRYLVHASLDLWAGLEMPLGPLRIALRVDYRLFDTHERVHGRDELFDLSIVIPAIQIGAGF